MRFIALFAKTLLSFLNPHADNFIKSTSRYQPLNHCFFLHCLLHPIGNATNLPTLRHQDLFCLGVLPAFEMAFNDVAHISRQRLCCGADGVADAVLAATEDFARINALPRMRTSRRHTTSTCPGTSARSSGLRRSSYMCTAARGKEAARPRTPSYSPKWPNKDSWRRR